MQHGIDQFSDDVQASTKRKGAMESGTWRCARWAAARMYLGVGKVLLIE